MAETQSFKHHTRVDPVWHFFVGPVFLINFFVSIYWAIHNRQENLLPHLWWIVLSLALLLLVATVRGYALKLQNRIVWLEERVRLSTKLTEPELNLLDGKQFIALRFASDNEVTGLARRAVTERLDGTAIKQAITSWRADHNRV